MANTHNMGGTSVYTTTAGIKFSDGTQQDTAAVSFSAGNTILTDNTGITITDLFGDTFQMSQTSMFFTLNGSGGGVSAFFDGTNFGAGISDGNGNALLLGDGFGNFNLSNEAGHAGIISTSGDICYVYGSPLFVGVAGGNGVTINTSAATFNCPLVIPTHTPSTSSDTGIAGQVAWDASYVYICTATNTWKRSALATW